MSGLGTRAAEPRRIFRAIAEAQAAHATALAAAAGTARAMILAEQRARAELMEAGACTAATYLAGPDLYAEARLLAQFAVLRLGLQPVSAVLVRCAVSQSQAAATSR